MIEWRCLVIAQAGERDWRRVHAQSAREAAALLASEGLTAIDVRSGPLTFTERLQQPVHLGGLMNARDQALSLRQLAMLLRAGLPVDKALDLVAGQMPRTAARHYFGEVAQRLRSGERLSEALSCRDAFPAFVTGVVGAAERSGQLQQGFAMLAVRAGEIAEARRDLVTALSYPAAVLAATLIALGVVVGIVIPQFEPLFAGETERLPVLTQFVLAFSRILHAHGPWLIGLPLAVLAGALIWARSEPGGAWLSRHARHVPGVELRDRFLAARLMTLLGTQLASGVPLVRALSFASKALPSRRWRSLCAYAEQALREGSSLSSSLARSPLIPNLAIRLIDVGERGGRLDHALSEAGELLQAGAKARVDRLVALTNPLAIASLGLVVTLLVGGVMLGIFALGDFAG